MSLAETHDGPLAGVAPLGWKDAAPRHHVAYLLPAVQRLIGPIAPGTRVLDIGCGNGALGRAIVTDELLDRGCSLVGVDPSETGIEIARAHHPRCRWERLLADETLLETLGEEPFDLVLSFEVVEHVYLPRAWARACYGALRPGGRLVCSTPYHGYLKNVLIAASGGFDRHVHPLKDGGHIKFFSRATLGALLTEVGFRSATFAGAGRLPGLWKSMVMLAHRP